MEQNRILHSWVDLAKRVLITGAFGLLGDAVVQELQPHFGLLATGIRVPENHPHYCPVQQLDVCDRNQVQRTSQSFKPHVIVNLAAFTDVDRCETEREVAWNTTVRGTQNLLDAVRRQKVRFIQISSDYIFDGESGPFDETAIPNPINYYGKTKLGAENVVRGSTDLWLILRTNVLYGASTRSKANFLQWVVQSLHESNPIRVVDDQWGNPTWTGGMAEAIRMAIILNARGIFNYGGAEFLTRYQFAQAIARVFDLDVSLIHPVSTGELAQRAPRPLRSGLTTGKIEEVLGLRTYTVEYCLRKVREGVIV
ncbi:MAG: SDR family oxidoreductase [Fidelibacterota bacterium]